MDACERFENTLPTSIQDIASELQEWFSVAGDMDDFIYYDDDEPYISER